MFRLALLLFSVIGTALAGSGIVVVLAMGLDTLQPVVVSALIGLLLAVPITWIVARRIVGAAR